MTGTHIDVKIDFSNSYDTDCQQKPSRTPIGLDPSKYSTSGVDRLYDHALALARAARPRELEALAAVVRRGVPVAREAVRERVVDDHRLVLVARERERARRREARVLRARGRRLVVLAAGLHGAFRAWGEVRGVPAGGLAAGCGRRRECQSGGRHCRELGTAHQSQVVVVVPAV